MTSLPGPKGFGQTFILTGSPGNRQSAAEDSRESAERPAPWTSREISTTDPRPHPGSDAPRARDVELLEQADRIPVGHAGQKILGRDVEALGLEGVLIEVDL